MSRVSAGSRAFRDNVPLLRPGDESANRAGSYAMSDLVQKLRARNACLSLDEAADRILERLCADIRRWRTADSASVTQEKNL